MTLAVETDLDELRRLAETLDGSPIPDVRMTEEEFVNWCPPELRAEWVNGEVFLMAPGNIDHEDINEWLITITRTFVDQHQLGRVKGSNFFIKLPDELRLPDLSFVSTERLSILGRSRIDGAPDLVMEIVSPDSRNRDRRQKFYSYESAGVREYWIIDPILRTIDLYSRNPNNGRFEEIKAADGKFSSVVLPGYFLRIEWLTGVAPPRPMDVFREFGLF